MPPRRAGGGGRTDTQDSRRAPRVYVAFDDDNLYFAARFHDSNPGNMVAKVLNKRDVSFGDDGFSITLDPFEISDGVVIPGGTYNYDHACMTLYTGEQRVLATESTVCEGGFYDGSILLFATRTTWRPSRHLKVNFGGEYNDVNLPQGDFITRLATLNLDVSFSTALSWENFIQYDNVSETVGVTSILRWIPRASQERSFASDLTLKLSYTFRY